MTPLQLAVASTVGLTAFLLSVILLNRGDRWFVNVRAQKEAALVGIAAFLLVSRPDAIGIAFTALFFAVAMLGRFSDVIEV